MSDDLYSGNEPYGQGEQLESSQRRMALMGLLRGRWHWAALLAVLLATAGGYLGYNSQKDIYQARTYIEFKPDYSDVPVAIADLSLYEPYVTFVNGERRRFKSRENVEKAMAQPEWQEHLANRPDDLPEITISSFAGAISMDQPAEKNETIFTVSFEDEDANTARAAINSLLLAYRQMQQQDQTTSYGENIRMLTDRVRESERERAAIEAQIKQVIPDEDVESLKTRRSFLQGLKTNLEFELNDIDLTLKPFMSLQDTGDQTTVRDMLMRDPLYKSLLDQKKAIEETLVEMTEIYGWDPPTAMSSRSSDSWVWSIARSRNLRPPGLRAIRSRPRRSCPRRSRS